MSQSEENSSAGVSSVCKISKVEMDSDLGNNGEKNEIDSESGLNVAGVDATTEDVEFVHDTEDGMIIGVEIFEESDLDTDTENKLQLYSDPAVDSSDALIPVVKIETKLKIKEQRDPVRLSLEDRIKCVRLCSRYKSFADAQKAWRQKYGTEPPCRKTLSTLDKKFERTGSVADLVRTGRPKTTRTEAVIAKVEEAVKRDPSKSIRSLAKELRINAASVHRIKKEFEDRRHTLKNENRKLRDRLNDALKRLAALEKKLMQNSNNASNGSSSSTMQPSLETLVFTSSGTDVNQIDGNNTTSGLPTIIALNSAANGHLSVPSVLRLQQPGQDVVHIIALPQSSSHQLLSFDESSSIQLATVPNDSVSRNQITLSNSNPVFSASQEQTSFIYKY